MLDKTAYVLFDLAVFHCEAKVLAEVFCPGGDDKCFQAPSPILRVAIQGPSNCPIAPSDALITVHGLSEVFSVLLVALDLDDLRFVLDSVLGFVAGKAKSRCRNWPRIASSQ